MKSDLHPELNELLEKMKPYRTSVNYIFAMRETQLLTALEKAYELGVNAEIESSYKDGNRLHL